MTAPLPGPPDPQPYPGYSQPPTGQPSPYGYPSGPPSPYGYPSGPPSAYGQPSGYGQTPWPTYPPQGQQAYGQQSASGPGYPQQPAPAYQGRIQPYGRMPFDRVGAATNLSLDYWLSAFFGWIPALIFYVVDKEKDPLLDAHLKEVLNFALTRLVLGFLAIIPFVGIVAVLVIGLGGLILGIMGAAQGADTFRRGQVYRYPVCIRFLS